MQATDEYWMTHLRSASAAEDRQLVQKENVIEHAKHTINVSTREREELQHALLQCNQPTRTWVSPFISIPLAHQILYGILKEEIKKDSTKGVTNFKIKLETDQKIKEEINDVLDTIEESAKSLESAYKSTEVMASSQASVDTVREEERRRKDRTWRDIPQDELAERLSKGEIITRDEWIPGISEGRRKLTPEQLQGHLAFGRQLHTEGNEAHKTGDCELALTRYTQGVNLLNWVEAEDDEGTREVDELLLTFLKNQSQVALRLGQYQTAKQAATTALDIDSHDGKALYRRAQAHLYLGDLPSAKNDYMAILKSPYTSTDSKMAARDGIKEMKKVVNKWKTNVTKLMTETTTQDTFSSNRPELPYHEDDTWDSRNHSVKSKPTSIQKQVVLPDIDVKPFLTFDETKYLLEQLIDIYTSDDTQEALNTIRRQADFDERRVLIRGKKLLPELLSPLLNEWKFKGETFGEQKREMEKCIQYWRLRNDEIKELTEDVYRSFLGDIID